MEETAGASGESVRPTAAESENASQRGGWRFVALIVLVLVVLNGWWIQVHRRWGLLDLDEAGYVRTAVLVGHERSLGGFWRALQQGFQGPLQALLAAPFYWVSGHDPRVLFWQSTLLLAFTAVVCFAMVRQLAGVGAGLVAALLVVCSDGLLDFSRTALTVMPAAAFSAAAMACLVASRGLRRTGWSIAFGASSGAMIIGRSMAIAYLPALAVAAVGWVLAGRTEWTLALRNAAAAVASAFVVAGWWWVARGADVLDYLSGPGLRGNNTAGARRPPVEVVLRQSQTLFWAVGQFAFEMVVAWVLLRWLPKRKNYLRPPRSDGRLPLWPIWAAVGAGLIALSPSSVTGTGFSYGFIPWFIVAFVAGARRGLSDLRWRIWVGVVAFVALVLAINRTGLGADANQGWCPTTGSVKQLQEQPDRWVCEVEDADSGRWQASIDDLTDRVRTLEADLQRSGRPGSILYPTRDWLVNGNSIASSAELRHSWTPSSAVPVPGGSDPAVLRAALDAADILVGVPDRAPVELGLDTPVPAAVADVARSRGFAECTEVLLPDRRVASVLVRRPLPAAGCR